MDWLLRRLARFAPRTRELQQPGMLALITTVVVSVTVDYATNHPGLAMLLQDAWGIDWDFACVVAMEGTLEYPTETLAAHFCPDGSPVVTVIDADSRTLMVTGVLVGLITGYTGGRGWLFRLGQRFSDAGRAGPPTV